MATLGDSTTPAHFSWFDTTGNKEFWLAAQVTMPAGGGVVTGMHLYIGGYGTSYNGTAVIWDNLTNVVWSSTSQSIGNGITWCYFAVPSVYLPAGNYELGFWSAGHVQWWTHVGGTVNCRSGLSSGPAPNNTSTDEYNGAGYGGLGVYLDYTPINVPGSISFAPTQGLVGTSVVLTSTYLTYASAVKFNGTPAVTWTIDSDTQITATVPVGATTGPISITNPAGTTTSAGNYSLGPGGNFHSGGVLKPLKGVWYKSGGVIHPVVGIWYKSGGVLKPTK